MGSPGRTTTRSRRPTSSSRGVRRASSTGSPTSSAPAMWPSPGSGVSTVSATSAAGHCAGWRLRPRSRRVATPTGSAGTGTTSPQPWRRPMSEGAIVVIGGTKGLGREVCRHYLDQGREVVLSGRDPDRAAAVAAELGGKARGIGLELTELDRIAAALADVGPVAHLVLAGIDRGANSVAEFDPAQAAALATQK